MIAQILGAWFMVGALWVMLVLPYLGDPEEGPFVSGMTLGALFVFGVIVLDILGGAH